MKFITSFEVESDTYQNFVKFAVKRAFSAKNQFHAFITNFIAWLLITVFFIFIFQSASSKISNIDWASAFIGALPFCIIIGYSLHANYKVKKFSIPNSNGIILGTKTIELTSDGLLEVSSVSKCQYSWASVEEIAVNNGDYYIFLDKMYALIIPRSAFASSGSIEQFKGCINEYV